MEFYFGTIESVQQGSLYSHNAREKHRQYRCECVVMLVNHHGHCQCNIFDQTICLTHHDFYCDELFTNNCTDVRTANEDHWVLEASKELSVSVAELRRRNLPENNLYSSICSITDEISKANTHKFLREHPGWQGFGSPSQAEDHKSVSWDSRRKYPSNDFISPIFLN